jgi:hypothetical protein
MNWWTPTIFEPLTLFQISLITTKAWKKLRCPSIRYSRAQTWNHPSSAPNHPTCMVSEALNTFGFIKLQVESGLLAVSETKGSDEMFVS